MIEYHLMQENSSVAGIIAVIAVGMSWMLAQCIKATVIKIRAPKTQWLEVFLWRTGGMPSSHSAIVTTLAAFILWVYGIRSILFAITLGYAAIIVRDAVGIRRTVGKLVRRLNHAEQKLGLDQAEDYQELKEVRGHEPAEVIAGVILGIVVGLIAALFV